MSRALPLLLLFACAPAEKSAGADSLRPDDTAATDGEAGGDEGTGDEGTGDEGTGDEGTGDDGGDDGAPATCGPVSGTASFTRLTVDSALPGAAYAAVGDTNGDGAADLVVSAFGAFTGFSLPIGEVAIYEGAGDGRTFSKTSLFTTSHNIAFPNQPNLQDLDSDGDLDALIPTGFFICDIFFTPCGGLSWWENTGSAWTEHPLVAYGTSTFYHHAELADLDGDGVNDLVSVGETNSVFTGASTALLQRFVGAGGGAFGEAEDLAEGGGSFPRARDIDGDGDLDLASAEYFVEGGSFAWFEQGASGDFTRHVIDDSVGPSIMLSFVDDLYGDGQTRAVGANHTNTAAFPADPWESAVYAYTPGADPTDPWGRAQLSSGIVSDAGSFAAPMAAPGIFGAGDLDADGDIDLVVSGDGDPQVYWMEQTSPGSFATHVLEADLPQAGGMVITDLDGDGCNEIVVTGYEANAVYVYRRADL
jgi:hypothetical protein